MHTYNSPAIEPYVALAPSIYVDHSIEPAGSEILLEHYMVCFAVLPIEKVSADRIGSLSVEGRYQNDQPCKLRPFVVSATSRGWALIKASTVAVSEGFFPVACVSVQAFTFKSGDAQ
jgi:hypothetical protein